MIDEPVDETGAEDLHIDVVSDLAASLDAVDEPERDNTGDERVDSVVADVARLTGRPVEEHVAVFESAHERLRRTLDEPDHHS
jgi:hypothetical protein